MSVNSVHLLGRVGKDVEVKDVNGTKCAIFTLATTEKYKDRNGEYQENTQWHNIVAWRQTADICEKFVKKGDQLFLIGKLTYRSWDGPSGEKKHITEIVVERVELLGSKNTAPVQPSAPQTQQRPQYKITPLPAAGDPEDDDLPFD